MVLELCPALSSLRQHLHRHLEMLPTQRLSRDCSSAIPSMMMTFKWDPTASVVVLSIPLWSGDLGGSFSNMAIRARFEEQCSMEPSGANIDLGTNANSYSPIVSLTSTSGGRWHTIIILAKRDRSSRNSISFSFEQTSTYFALLFQAQSFVFFTVDQRLTLSDWMRSLIKVSNSVCPMTLWLHISSLMLSGITTLVTR